MINIKINNQAYQVKAGLTLIQVCDQLGIQIPRFCYHAKLPVVGSCRMCLIEIAGARKLSPACTTSITDGLEIITESPNIAKVRKSMLEMLLVNHPLECPICDQGGECDLQDQSYVYGLDTTAINISKRAVTDKFFAPTLDTHMTRCIHCTRCVRFLTEIVGVNQLGAIGRGDLTEINTYLEHGIYSELSGNLADICPVGALNHNLSAYKRRSWEFRNTETIDILDSLGANITVQSVASTVVRIQPRLNEEINGEWLGDKSRYVVDALNLQRLDTPLLRTHGTLKPVTWEVAFNTLTTELKKVEADSVAVIAGDFNSIESLFAMKSLMNNLKVDKLECRVNGVNFNPQDRADYLFNSKIAGIDKADACLIIGSNPKLESPILNARIRQRYLQGDFPIAVVASENFELNYNYNYLGNHTEILEELLSGKHKFSKILAKAKNPILILGLGALVNNNQVELINLCKKIAIKYKFIQADWNGYNVLQTSMGLLNGLYTSFVASNNTVFQDNLKTELNSNIKFLWLMNYDNLKFTAKNKDMFVVYQGHHGDAGALNANLILPEPLWLEQDGTYINLEGRLQQAVKAISPIAHAKDSWKIIRKFSEIYGKKLPFDTLADIRMAILKEHHDFNNIFIDASFNKSIKDKIDLSKTTLNNYINNYYITDIISKNSPKMAECTQFINNKLITKEI